MEEQYRIKEMARSQAIQKSAMKSKSCLMESRLWIGNADRILASARMLEINLGGLKD